MKDFMTDEAQRIMDIAVELNRMASKLKEHAVLFDRITSWSQDKPVGRIKRTIEIKFSDNSRERAFAVLNVDENSPSFNKLVEAIIGELGEVARKQHEIILEKKKEL